MNQGNDELVNFNDDESEIVSRTIKSDTKKKYTPMVASRSQEEYETYITGSYKETWYKPNGEAYEVTITVLKPEVNPMELLRPAYAFSS